MVAGLGALVVVLSIAGLALVLAASRSESGFAEGLAILVFGVHALGGFVVLAVGLLVPQSDESGLRFSARQRLLLAYGAAAPVVAVLSVPIGARLLPPLAPDVHSLLVAGLVVLVLSGPAAVVLALGLRFRARLVPARVAGSG